jgi:hypothetical protein
VRFLGFLEGQLWESFEIWCALGIGVGWDGRTLNGVFEYSYMEVFQGLLVACL